MLKRLLVMFAAFAVTLAAPTAFTQTGDADFADSQLFSVQQIFQDGSRQIVRMNGKTLEFQRMGKKALIRFEGDEEVWSLYQTIGQRGDEFWKNDVDRLILRLTDLGGIILYSAEAPNGEPVEATNSPSQFPNPSVRGSDYISSLTSYVTLRLGQEMSVQINSITTANTVWLEDAARVAVKGMIKTEHNVGRISKLLIVEDQKPDLSFLPDGTLKVHVVPELGYFGRPSSDRVILFLRKQFTS